MTLPKTFSFESSTITNNTSSLSSHQGQEEQQQTNLNDLHLTTMSSIPSVPNATNLDKNNAMFDANSLAASLPLQQIPENKVTPLLVECVMPGIYLSKDFISWKKEELRAHGFTHIIIIDKHIQELYYPNQQPDIFKLCSMNKEKTISLTHDTRRNDGSSNDAFDYYCSSEATNHFSFDREFEVIDLNFGEKSYLTTVLPNCYRAVKFINKALQAGGTILVIDCNGGEQKCLTIIVAYLMYKHNINFSNAFARLKQFYKKADLDRFYISQLYEYEPILQVQRAQSRGHSCSRELHAAILKRKKTRDDDDDDDNDTTLDNHITNCSPLATSLSCYSNATTYTTTTSTTDLLNNCNPLNRFDSTQMERHSMKPPNYDTIPGNGNLQTITRFMHGTTITTTTATVAAASTGGGWHNWEDYAME